MISREWIDRNKLCQWLDEQGVGNRPVFGGNLLYQPAYKNIRARIVDNMRNSDTVHERAFWVGCWPGLEQNQVEYAVSKLAEYVRSPG